jgi:hypothetical protein
MDEAMNGSVVLTGDQVTAARWLTVRSALGLEIRTGMTRRGRPVRVLANEITGGGHRSKRAAYGALDVFISERLGEGFAKPLT